MPLDTSIPLSAREFRLTTPFEAQTQAIQLRNLQAQEQQRTAQSAAAQRAQQDQVALSDVYRQHYNNPEEFDRTAAQRGLGHALPGIQKGRAEIDEKRAKVRETDAQTKNWESMVQERGVDTVAKQTKHVIDTMGWISGKQGLTDDDVIRALASSPPEMRQAAEQVMRTAPWGQGEGALKQWAMNLGRNAQQRWEDLNVTAAQKLQADTTKRGHDMTAQTAREGHGVTMRGQNMTDARGRSEGVANREVQRYGIDQVSVRQKEANEVAATGNVIKTETDLRKEFADLPEVKRYKAAIPAYNAVETAATRGTPQSDINLIYGLAKLYDPDSVVREGEYATIANSQAIPEWLKGLAQRAVGGGRLTPETKRQIMTEAKGRIGSYESEFTGAQDSYRNIVQQRGGRPESVFTPVGASRKTEPEKPAAAKAPAAGAVEGGYRFKGGDPSKPENWVKQ